MKRSVCVLSLAALTVLLGCGAAEPGSDLDSFSRKDIGGIIMVGFQGTAASSQSEVGRMVRDLGVAGVFYFGPNITGRTQVKKLSDDLQAMSSDTLLIATDQEGGQVARLKASNGFHDSPTPAQMGRKSPADTFATARVMAQDLRDAGINLNLAPVVDVNTNPKNPIIAAYGRSFSGDENQVTAHAKEFARAHVATGIQTSLKHFPGHGSSTTDSHLGFTDVSNTWSRRELSPFTNVLAAYPGSAVMTAHIVNEQLDSSGLPATLSRKVITDLLRNQLGFRGLILSDSMNMGAITQEYTTRKAVRLALHAGVNILSFASASHGQMAQIVEWIYEDSFDENGNLTQLGKAVQDSLQKVKQFKAQL